MVQITTIANKYLRYHSVIGFGITISGFIYGFLDEMRDKRPCTLALDNVDASPRTNQNGTTNLAGSINTFTGCASNLK